MEGRSPESVLSESDYWREVLKLALSINRDVGDLVRMAPERDEIVWAAGIFDANGGISIADGWLHLQLHRIDFATVQRFAAAVHAGKIGGPYSNKAATLRDGSPRQDSYMWYTRRGEPVKVLALLWPHLTATKKKRAAELGYTEIRGNGPDPGPVLLRLQDHLFALIRLADGRGLVLRRELGLPEIPPLKGDTK